MNTYVFVLTKSIEADSMSAALHTLLNEPLTHTKITAIVDNPEGGEETIRGIVADAIFLP